MLPDEPMDTSEMTNGRQIDNKLYMNKADPASTQSDHYDVISKSRLIIKKPAKGKKS